MQSPTPTLLTPQPARHPNPLTKAQALAYLIFERPDLDLTERFLTDFGLKVAERRPDALFMRSTGEEPFCYVVLKAPKARFVGLGFRVASQLDLKRLSRLPDASLIEPSPWPGGGERVRLQDPSGFVVDAVHGVAAGATSPHRPPLLWNVADARLRIDATQRSPAEPPEVLRLGHVVLEASAFQATSAWYTQTFGLIPSDIQVLPDGSPAVAFMRLDLGDQPADHHTVALAQGVAPLYSHSAFEVVDADAVGMGQRVLRERGWKHAWGIGRHILGSQVFDYWHDPYGDKHEHYTDGDLFTGAAPTGVHPTSRAAMSQWGEPMPTSFSAPKLSLPFVLTVLRNVRNTPDLTFSKLRVLAKIFS